jgi:hypothetical protein
MAIVKKMVNYLQCIHLFKYIRIMNLDILDFLFNDFIGGADDDELYLKYKFINLDNYEDRVIIITEIQNHYFDYFDNYQKEDLLVLLNYLIENSVDINKEINRLLLPFDFPKDTKLFLMEIKTTLYKNI